MGEFVNDTRWGLGTAYYKDGGPKYIGTWLNGFPQGPNGTLFLLNGQKYVGEFQQGQPMGNGTLYGPDGSIIREGIFGSRSQNEDETDFGFLPRINLTDNKYVNLIKKIVDFVGFKWPFSK